jgi:hypothetical protein
MDLQKIQKMTNNATIKDDCNGVQDDLITIEYKNGYELVYNLEQLVIGTYYQGKVMEVIRVEGISQNNGLFFIRSDKDVEAIVKMFDEVANKINQSKYNATLIGMLNGKPISTGTCKAEMINGRLQLMRANGLQHTTFEEIKAREGERGLKEGDSLYEWYYKKYALIKQFKIIPDNCHIYECEVKGLAVGPSYK